jgi:hypothetical protein
LPIQWAQMLSIQSSCPPIRSEATFPVSTAVPPVPPATGLADTETATPPRIGGADARSPTNTELRRSCSR